MKILIVVAAVLWTTSAFGVVRCETNGKVEYRDAPCPQGAERSISGTPGAASSPNPLPSPASRSPVAARPLTDAEREDENARFLQQERRIREERLKVEAEQVQREAARPPVAAAAEAASPAVVPEPPSSTPAPAPAAETRKAARAIADQKAASTTAGNSTSKFGGFWLYLLPLAIVVVLAIVETRRGSGNSWRWSLAAILGLLSGFLLYFIAFMLFMPKGGPGPMFVLVTLSGGWVLSAWFMGNGAESLLRVLRRGFLLGAIEWLIVIPASWVWTGRAVVSTVEQMAPTVYGRAGAILGGSVIALITGGVAFVMLVLCVIGYLIVYFVQRGRTPAAATPQEVQAT